MAPFCFYKPKDMYDGEFLKIFLPLREAPSQLGTIYQCEEGVAYLTGGIGNRKVFSVERKSHQSWRENALYKFLLTKRGAARTNSEYGMFVDFAQEDFRKWSMAPTEQIKTAFVHTAVAVASEEDLEGVLHKGLFCPKCEKNLDKTLVAFVQEVAPYWANIDGKKRKIEVKGGDVGHAPYNAPDHPGFDRRSDRKVLRFACWRCGVDVTADMAGLDIELP